MKLSQVGKRIRYALRKRIYRIYTRFLGPRIRNIPPDIFLRSANHPDLHTVGDLMESLRIDQGKMLLSMDADSRIFAEIIENYHPGSTKKYLHRADQICDHVFDILGSGPTKLGDSINWHFDFIQGHQWDSKTFYSNICVAPYPGGYDIKVPWELSRCHHLVWLGQAYLLSGNENYSHEFTAEISSWIENNPYPLGVNWASTMEVAVRAVNWLLAFQFFSHSPICTVEFQMIFLKSLLLHGRHIKDNLEWSPSLTTNHYLSNIVGLIFLGFLLPEFKESKNWRNFGLQELSLEMEKQVHPDGVGKEASTSYHRLITELFLSATLLAERNGYVFRHSFKDRLEKMLEVIQYISRQDGTAPLLGDNDNGRLYRFHLFSVPEREWTDFRYLLAIGAVIFQRGDFAWTAEDQWHESYWLFGSTTVEHIRKAQKPAQRISRSFPNGGWYILTHADLHIVVSAGPNGQNGVGGHAHNDKLSITIQDHGQDWLIDPGMYCYTSDYDKRLLFRSTAFHNTVRIDYQEQNRLIPNRAFSLINDASVIQHIWETNPKYDLFDASHNGYCRFNLPVKHRRLILLWKDSDPYLIIKDIITGEGIHDMELFFQIGNVNTKIISPTFIHLQQKSDPEVGMGIYNLGDQIPDLEIVNHFQSLGYGMKIPNQALRLHTTTQLPHVFLTIFYRYNSTLIEVNSNQIRKLIEPGLKLLQEL